MIWASRMISMRRRMKFEKGVGAISVKLCSEVEAELKARWSMLHS